MKSLQLVCATLLLAAASSATALDRVRVNPENQSFVLEPSGKTFTPWGVNYDHDSAGRLLDEYWIEEWETVVADFAEIKQLGANCVRIHLQYGKFMETVDQPNAEALEQLAKLLKLAEETELYLDITGLACYHKANVPGWYDALEEPARWTAQANFWRAVASTCKDSPAVFCYDLMNEPVIGGGKTPTDWLAGEPLGDKFFVQRITLDTGDRSREAVAEAWVQTLTSAIREEDPHHLVTVGVIPWAQVWPNAKPVFYAPGPAKHLDFVSVHFYPERDQLQKTLAALKVYDIGKPIVVEETFPLKCSITELIEFVHAADGTANGWISFYWGKQIGELDETTLPGKITADWYRAFQAEAPNFNPKETLPQ